jgi:hypothetical protein
MRNKLNVILQAVGIGTKQETAAITAGDYLHEFLQHLELNLKQQQYQDAYQSLQLLLLLPLQAREQQISRH